MNSDLATHYLDEAHRQMRGHKRLAEGAMAQLKDNELFIALDPEANSIAVIVKHMAETCARALQISSPAMARRPTAIAMRSSI